MKTFKTYLPVFTGFYDTIFESDNEDSEIQDINSQRESKGLKPIDSDDCIFDYAGYHNEVSKECTEYLHNELRLINVVRKIEFEALCSPKEFNFHNDSINVEITLTEDNIKTIKKYLYDNQEDYAIYLHGQYTSYSGFISFFPNTFDGWVELTKDFTDFSEKMHILGSILDFICMTEEINTDMMYDSLNTTSVYASNYMKLVEG